jgi:hypothetical protein
MLLIDRRLLGRYDQTDLLLQLFFSSIGAGINFTLSANTLASSMREDAIRKATTDGRTRTIPGNLQLQVQHVNAG